jgi:NADPH-dependent 2,4-dienoyl-CoA reductase/sulfur reductase-like enzyme
VHLDTEAHMVITDTDEVFEYDGLVIATGAYAMAPPGGRSVSPACTSSTGWTTPGGSARSCAGPTPSPSSAAA